MCSEARRYAALSAAAWMVSLLVVLYGAQQETCNYFLHAAAGVRRGTRSKASIFFQYASRACVRV